MAKNQHGFTLVEMTTGMVAGTILVLAFSSVLVVSRRQSSAATDRVNAFQDVWVADQFIHKQLSKAVSDSTKIYADTTAEQSSTPSTSGTILRATDSDGISYRIAVANQTLDWQVDGQSFNPVDTKVPQLTFQETSSTGGKKIDIGMTFLSGEDTLAYEWTITCRN